ncbi:MAG: MFS transporter [Planctomyces sp.]|nr:MFS transporter [Planctomyces sp.]
MTQAIPIRYRVVFLSFLVSALLYIDRFVLTYVQSYVRDDLGLTRRETGWLLSAFFWSYALAQVPSGWLTDRYGPRRMLTLYIVAWSAGTAAMGWVHGFAMLLLTRLAIGIAQAGAYPACASVVGRWAPMSGRGIANAIVTFGGRLGSGITPLVTAALLMLYAGRSTSPDVQPRDILVPHHLAVQLSAARELADSDDLDEEAAARRDVLLRVVSGMSPEEISELERLAAEAAGASNVSRPSARDRLTGLPSDVARATPLAVQPRDREFWAALLTRTSRGPLLASPEQLLSLPVEREVRRSYAAGDIPSSEHPRLNRLILESALPGSLRSMYAAGWRHVMMIFGAGGLVIAAGYWIVVRDRPAEHPRVTREELATINEGRLPLASTGAPGRLPIRAIVASPSLWLISFLQLCTNIGWTFLVLQLPEYLQKVQNCSLETRSFHASIPIWAGWVGMFLGGWFTDWCTRRFGLRLGRMVPLSGTRFVAAGAFLMMMFEPSLWTATAMFSLVAFSTDVGVPAVWAYNQDVGGRYIASVLGWGNMWGNIGSALSPLIVVEALERFGDWSVPFGICAGAFAAAGVCGLFIDATRPIDEASASPRG